MSFDEIILKVQSKPELWCSRHPYYRNRAVHKRIWHEIGSQLAVDETVVKKRWKHLKDQYRKELKKIMSANNGEFSEEHVSYWQHFHNMAFIKEELLQGDKTRRYWLEATVESDSESQEDGESSAVKSKRSKKNPDVKNPSDLKIEAVEEETKCFDGKKVSVILRRLNSMNELIEKKIKTSDDMLKNDSDYMFLVSLLPSMKKLTDIQKLHFRGKINDWLLDAITQNEYQNQCDTKVFLQNQINEEMHNED